MSKELATIPANIPANISSLFAKLSNINADAADGIGVGIYPMIRLNGTRFTLVKDGEATPVKSLEMKVVILRAKAGFEKRWYAKAYDPNSDEGKAPDCYSLNGQTPEPNCEKPQNSACAGCVQNQFGSGRNQAGEQTKGKACTDRKLLAVLYPNPDTKQLEIYGLSLPPASLKAFGAYVNTLTNNNIPLPAAFTTLSFDDNSSFPVLTFTFGGLLGEKELARIIPMTESAEVKAIIETRTPTVAPILTAPVPKQEEAKEESGFGFTPEPEKKEKKKAPLKAVEKPAPAPEPEVIDNEEEGISDDALKELLGL